MAIASLREAAASGDFPLLLKDSMNKIMLKEYQGAVSNWKKYCSIDDKIRDFKTKNVVRLSEADSLAEVKPGGEYKSSTLKELGHGYHVRKFGRTFDVLWETIINDDIGAIKKQPRRFGRAAGRSLNKFVVNDLLEGNVKTYDNKTLFHEAHKNLSDDKLSRDAVEKGIIAILNQTDDKNNKLGLAPKYLIVPPDKYFMAIEILKSVYKNAEMQVNAVKDYLEPLIEPFLTDPNAWYLACDPVEVDTIEVGFLKEIGQNPQLFVKDPGQLYANSGAKVDIYQGDFENDKIVYKVRHVFGGTAVDYRGLYKGTGTAEE